MGVIVGAQGGRVLAALLKQMSLYNKKQQRYRRKPEYPKAFPPTIVLNSMLHDIDGNIPTDVIKRLVMYVSKEDIKRTTEKLPDDTNDGTGKRFVTPAQLSNCYKFIEGALAVYHDEDGHGNKSLNYDRLAFRYLFHLALDQNPDDSKSKMPDYLQKHLSTHVKSPQSTGTGRRCESRSCPFCNILIMRRRRSLRRQES